VRKKHTPTLKSLKDCNGGVHLYHFIVLNPDYLPSIDKKNFIDGWFLYCLKSWCISRSCVLAERLVRFLVGYFGDDKILPLHLSVGLAGVIVES